MNHPSLSSGGMPNNIDNTNGGKEFRNTIQGFVSNCKRRHMYEAELRTERRFGDDYYVPIPPPGVPSEIAVSLEDLLDNEEDNQLEMKNGDDFFDTPVNMVNKEDD